MAISSMPNQQAGPLMSVADIYANARALSGYLREKSTAIDEARRLPADVVTRVREAGLFRLTMPKTWGGPELSTMEQLEVIEELSKANASVGWCVMIGCDSGIFSAHLDDAAGRRLYPHLDMATAAWLIPAGRADRVDGGYRISGQWMFGSGISHADVVSAGCLVHENGAPVMNSAGTVVRKNSTAVMPHGPRSRIRGEVRSARSAPSLGPAGQSNGAGVATVRVNGRAEREARGPTKSVVGRDCNAAAKTAGFFAGAPRSRGSANPDTPAGGSR